MRRLKLLKNGKNLSGLMWSITSATNLSHPSTLTFQSNILKMSIHTATITDKLIVMGKNTELVGVKAKMEASTKENGKMTDIMGTEGKYSEMEDII